MKMKSTYAHSSNITLLKLSPLVLPAFNTAIIWGIFRESPPTIMVVLKRLQNISTPLDDAILISTLYPRYCCDKRKKGKIPEKVYNCNYSKNFKVKMVKIDKTVELSNYLFINCVVVFVYLSTSVHHVNERFEG